MDQQNSELENSELDTEKQSFAPKAIAIVIGIGVTVFGLVIFAGWMLHITALLTPTISRVNTKVNAAIGFILYGIVLLLLTKHQHRTSPAYSFLIQLLSIVIILLSGATLLEYMFGWQLGIDELLVRDTFPAATSSPGRIGPNSAACFLLSGIASLCALRPNSSKWSWAGSLSNSLVFVISILSLTGYAYAVKNLYAVSAFTEMAFGTTLVHLATAVGRSCACPNEEPVATLISRTTGGFVARRLIPMALAVPIALGWLLYEVLAVHLHADRFAHAVYTVAMAVILSAVCYWVANQIKHEDAIRRTANKQIELLNRQLETQLQELKETNRELQIAKEQAEHASVLKSTFVANISHELRTPISAITGANELLLQDRTLKQGSADLVRSAQDCAHALLALVNDLLDISKLEFGRFTLQNSSFNPVKLVEQTLQSYVGKIGADTRLCCQLDPMLPEQAVGDPNRTRQVLLNLINNAIKFTPSGEITVKAARDTNHLGDAVLTFTVSDTGIGISKSDQNLLFLPFSQIDSSATRRYNGAGLGLSISKSIVELMGGEIGLKSEKGQGSEFWFSIPLLTETLDFSPEPAAPFSPAQFNRQSILLVEDNPVIQKIVAQQLSSFGLSVHTVSTGTEAVEAVKTEEFSLILMDCNLPDISGLDVTKQIRQLEAGIGRHTAIVALTAAAMKEDRQRCLTSGMDDYLSKPVAMAQLRETIRKWMTPSSSRGF